MPNLKLVRVRGAMVTSPARVAYITWQMTSRLVNERRTCTGSCTCSCPGASGADGRSSPSCPRRVSRVEGEEIIAVSEEVSEGARTEAEARASGTAGAPNARSASRSHRAPPRPERERVASDGRDGSEKPRDPRVSVRETGGGRTGTTAAN